MSTPKKNKMLEEVYPDCASANDCTGLFQRIHLDPEEVKTFHRMYNDLDKDDKK